MVRRVALPLVVCVVAALLGAASPKPDIQRAEIPSPAGMENHGAAIAELPSGTLLACWYSGAHEEDRSVSILCSHGSNDGAAWSQPWTAVTPGDQAVGASRPNKSLGNVTLTVTPDGRVWMVHGVIQSRFWPFIGSVCNNWVCGRIDARVSADEGASWSRATRLVDIGGALPRAELKPVAGGYLAPFYEENQQRPLIAKVSLGGQGAKLVSYWRLRGWKLIQPTLAPLGDGNFRVYFRDQRRRGVFTDVFNPATGAWTTPELTNLPNPGAAIDVFDHAGRFVLIYNPSSTTRDVLSLARSSDGVHFETGCDLSVPEADHIAAYPSVIRGQDGDWRAVYSANAKGRIKFVRFSSAWLEECFAHKA